MVDYVPFLARAVAALSPNTREQRSLVYDRARRVLVDKLRTSTLSQAERDAETAALEAAIGRVEGTAPRADAPLQPISAYDGPDESYWDRPPLKDGRNPLRIAVGAFGALLILIAGTAIYSSWPRIISAVRSVGNPRSVTAVAERPGARSNFVRLRQLVYYRSNQPVGTIIVDKTQTFLYVVRPNVSALRYSIGIGTECDALAGLYHVVRKEELSGGNQPTRQSDNINVLGVRVLYLEKDYRIHGSDAPAASVQRLPEGCIRMINDDVIYLYDRTPLTNRVVVSN